MTVKAWLLGFSQNKDQRNSFVNEHIFLVRVDICASSDTDVTKWMIWSKTDVIYCSILDRSPLLCKIMMLITAILTADLKRNHSNMKPVSEIFIWPDADLTTALTSASRG